LPRNFPVIDGWEEEEGVATSIKSIDLNAATYQNGMGLTYRLNQYIDSLASFEGDTMGDIVIENSDISGRVLDIAVPRGSMTAAQKAAIDAASLRAQAVGIKLVITEF
jgi:Iap family predicted aminopeptidase